MVAAAEEQARHLGLAVCVAVVGGGGNLIALHPMDGARITITVSRQGDLTFAADAIAGTIGAPWRTRIIDREPDRVVIRTSSGPVTVTSRIEPGDVCTDDAGRCLVVIHAHWHDTPAWALCVDDDRGCLTDVPLADLRITARCARTEVA